MAGAWSAGGNLATARYFLAGCGTQSAGLSFGGTTGANSAVTEEYNPVITAPTVTTQAASDITVDSATLNGNITATGGENATARGFYLVEGSGTPDSGDTVISASGSFGTGAFTGSATGLTGDTLYSARAFATNSAGTSVGDVIEFTTEAAASSAMFFMF